MSYLTVPFKKSFCRDGFHCEKPSLDAYIKTQVSQDIKEKLAVCFVLLAPDQKSIIGYYTLSNGSIPYKDVPENLRKKYPQSYDYIPVTLLGRLALDVKFKGQGLGGKILIDALKRSLKVAESDFGSVAVIVDPLDQEAVSYYKHYGFNQLPSSGKMFLDMNTIQKLDC